jgi:hypothetical protein
MRRVAVIGPNPPCGALSAERFVEMLSGRLGLEAFSLRPLPGLMLAANGPAQVPLARATERDYGASVLHVDADTLIWLRFLPRAYLRDWAAGWLDVVLNGEKGARRRAYRARLADVVRSCFSLLQKSTVDARQLESLRPQVLLIELSSPEQALFWLEMQEERVRETIPPV